MKTLKKKRHIPSWIFSVIFFLFGLCTLGQYIAAAFLFMGSGVVLNPVVRGKLRLKTWMSVVLSLLLLFVGFAFVPSSGEENLDDVTSSISLEVEAESSSDVAAEESIVEEAITSDAVESEEVPDEEETQVEAEISEAIPDDTGDDEAKEPSTDTDENEAEEVPADTASVAEQEASTEQEAETEEPEAQDTTASESEEAVETETIVYITNTGSKYHRSSCRTLKDSKIEITLSDAVAQGYEPCKICNPPTK